MRASARMGVLVSAVLGIWGCGGDDAQPKTPRKAPNTHTGRGPAAPRGPDLLPAQLIGAIEDEGAPWHYARGRSGALALWIAKGRWWARRMGDDGVPAAEPVDVAPAGATTLSTLAPLGDGWLAVWVEPVVRNHTVFAIELDAQGKPRAPATAITQVPDEINWVEALPNGRGALLLWEITREQRSDLYALPLAGGKASGAATAVVRGALGWQATATDRGAAIALVSAPAPKAVTPLPARSPLGRVELVELDVTGKPSAPIVVHADASAQIDVEVAEISGGYLVAWTDERDIDPSVQLAVVSGGKVTVTPKRATAPSGEQALVALVRGADGKRALIAWEELLHTGREGRVVKLATVDAAGVLSDARARMLLSSTGRPDIVADGAGFAAMTLAPASLAAGQEPAQAPLWPTFVRFGGDLAVRASEPVRAAPFTATQAVPEQTRFLSCGGKGGCSTLATGAGPGAPLAVVDLPVRKSAWRAAAWREAIEAPPRSASLVALVDGEPLADVAAVSDQGSQLCAWVTYFIEGAKSAQDKKAAEPAFATLGARAITGGVPGKLNVISRRAISIGGVSLAASSGAKRETILGWVAKERTEPQVFLTKLGLDGTKKEQKALTVVPRRPRPGIPNEVYDVAVAYSGEGGEPEWTVAWIDTRDGDAEVYVARVDKDLKKTIPDRRITEVPGDASEVQLLVAGKDTWLAWSDARGDADAGAGDIYVVRLETRTLKKQGEETRLFASAGHSRSPRFATGGALALSWIEDGTSSTRAAPRAQAKAAPAPPKPGQTPARPKERPEATSTREEAAAMVAQLDEKGALVGAPVVLRGERGVPVTSAALACPPAAAGARPACRLVMTTPVRESLQLTALELTLGGPVPAAKTLATLTGGHAQDAAPAFADATAQQLFFADDAAGGSGRLRWMTIGWK